MKLYCEWELTLPFKYKISSMKNTEVEINGIEIKLGMDNDTLYSDKLIVGGMFEGQEGMIENDEQNFYQNAVKRTGMVVKEFIDSLCKQLKNGDQYLIFDGSDFIIPYIFDSFNYLHQKVNNNIHSFTDEMIEYSNIDVHKRLEGKHTYVDFVNDLIWQSFNFYRNGSFEMAILNLAMLIECLIKGFIEEAEMTIKPKKYAGNGFVEKYFQNALRQVSGKSIKDFENGMQLYSVLKLIYTCRNQIVHGGSLYDEKFLKKIEKDLKYLDIKDVSMKDLVKHMIDIVYEVIFIIDSTEFVKMNGT